MVPHLGGSSCNTFTASAGQVTQVNLWYGNFLSQTRLAAGTVPFPLTLLKSLAWSTRLVCRCRTGWVI